MIRRIKSSLVKLILAYIVSISFVAFEKQNPFLRREEGLVYVLMLLRFNIKQ